MVSKMMTKGPKKWTPEWTLGKNPSLPWSCSPCVWLQVMGVDPSTWFATEPARREFSRRKKKWWPLDHWRWILKWEPKDSGVSKNRGIPKWMVYNGKPYCLMDDLGVIFGNTHIDSWICFVGDFFVFYHGKSPLNHHLGDDLFIK